MKSNLIIPLCCFLLLPLLGMSQLNNGGVPLTFYKQISIGSELPKKLLPTLNNIEELNRTQILSNSTFLNYYGTIVDIEIDIRSEAVTVPLDNGGTLWLLEIESSGAYGMQLYFDEFNLPPGATLYFYNEGKTQIQGSFTERNNQSDPNLSHPFGTDYLKGDKIIVEYYEPNGVPFQGSLKVAKAVHSFKSPYNESRSLSCEVNVACPSGTGLEIQSSSVAHILVNDFNNNAMSTCSGTLINNTSNDGTPYFLSAGHCIANSKDQNGNYDASNWVFKFNYQSTDCFGTTNNHPNELSIFGATYLTGDHVTPVPLSDHLLLQLWGTSNDFEAHDICYASWDIRDVYQIGDEITSIHHPDGDIKKISRGEIVSKNLNIFTVDWFDDEGTVEPGSSGGPLFNVLTGAVVGQLRGRGTASTNDCFWINQYNFNRLDYSYPDISQYLDPSSTGQNVCSKFCPNEPTSPPDPGCNYTWSSLANNNGDGYDINHSGEYHAQVCLDQAIEISAQNNGTYCYAYWDFTNAGFIDYDDCSNGGDPQSIICNSFLGNCSCRYERIFIALSECDNNLTQIGAEYGEWKNIVSHSFSGSSDPMFSTYSSQDKETFDLRSFLPSGATLEIGKIYRLKLALGSGNSGWQEQTKYISIVDPNSDLYINSQNIVLDQFGQGIYISNSTVNTDIEVVAANQIQVAPSTIFHDGIYKIGNADCSELNKSMLIVNNHENDAGASSTSEIHAVKDNTSSIESSIFNELSIYPNPTSGRFTLAFDEPVSYGDVVEVRDLFGKLIRSQILTSKKTTMDLTGESKGIYLVKIQLGNELITKKVIYQ